MALITLKLLLIPFSVGGQGDDRPYDEGTPERDTPAARSGNDLLIVAAPVCRADP